ncbi:hypothetical protein JW872_03025 [Candidatus Babeliales bacterium]|nr:hypothetical protein [Candidatus Babeliales bacterium]
MKKRWAIGLLAIVYSSSSYALPKWLTACCFGWLLLLSGVHAEQRNLTGAIEQDHPVAQQMIDDNRLDAWGDMLEQVYRAECLDIEPGRLRQDEIRYILALHELPRSARDVSYCEALHVAADSSASLSRVPRAMRQGATNFRRHRHIMDKAIRTLASVHDKDSLVELLLHGIEDEGWQSRPLNMREMELLERLDFVRINREERIIASNSERLAGLALSLYMHVGQGEILRDSFFDPFVKFVVNNVEHNDGNSARFQAWLARYHEGFQDKMSLRK